MPTLHPRPLSALALGLILVITPTAGAAPPAMPAGQGSSTSTDHYAIPPQPLYSALDALAEQAGLQLVYSSELVQALDSPGVTGDYTLEDALNRLLAGTGLTYRYTGPGTVTLQRPDPLEALVAEAKKSRQYAGAAQAAPKKPEAPPKETQEGPTVLPEMTVTATPYDETSYTARNASTATKSDTPIFDTPVSIQVVPYQVIQDQKGYQIENAVENVSGVRTNSLSGYADIFIVRGFTAPIFRNGLQLDFTTFDTVTAERIEVLKGPASILYGRSEPGGLINLVTKKPLNAPYYSAEQQFGSYDFFRTQWDSTGPLNQDRSLLYRFTGAYQNNDSFRDFHDLERVLLYPSLTWRPTSATEVTIDLEYIHDDTHVDYFGIPAIGTRPAPVPISRSFQDPNDPSETFDRIRLGFNLSHCFNESWTVNNRFLAAFHDWLEQDLNPAGVRADHRTLDRVATLYGVNDDFYHTNLDLTGKFTLWDTDHETLVGFDYFRSSRQGPFLFQSFDDPDPALAIDIFNPRYGIDPAVFNIENLSLAFFFKGEDEQYGVYFQDHITLWDKLHILGGGRYDWATVAGGNSDISIDAIRLDERSDEAFSPRVGLLYQPWPWLGVYGNWVQSFGTNNGRSATGEPHAPQTGEQFEAGLKTQLFESQLTATLAYFHLTKGNILTPDLFTPNDPFDTVPIGEARSEGVELDIAGRLTDTLSLIGSYAYTDAKITKDSRGLQGNQLLNAPLHSGSLWLKYDVNGYQADGLSFGVGVFANGHREGDSENTFQLPGYARLEALAAYRWTIGPSRLIAQLNIRNLLDKEYYENADINSNNAPRNAIWPGAPLTVLGSVQVEW